MSFNSNPLYASSWHFNLIGNIETIWAEFNGNGIVVAVYDDGVQSDHPDMDDNYDASLELPFPYDDSYPDNGTMGHGTAVAGIVAGENNTMGGVGVAWSATIVGNDFFEGQTRAGLDLQEIQAMANFDVINSSWGYSFFNSRNDISNLGNAAFVSAYEDVVASGRGGLGSIIVKSAGNAALSDFPGSQNDSLNVLRYSIAVGATDANGDTTNYSSWGSNLLVSAPAAAYTSDLTFGGYDGLPDTDYTNQFGGTSAAAPVVSGVVALMLEANAGLGWRDVQQILASSAAQTGSNFGASASGFEDGAWISNGADTWNGGGFTYHINYGFGMVDAFAAVRMAEIWTTMHGGAMTLGNEISSQFFSGYVGGTITFGSTVTDTITVATSEVSIETIYVEVDMTHTWSDDLTIILVAPDGTEFILHDQNGLDEHHNGFTYAVTGALGMSSLGQWTLSLSDNVRLDDGTLFDWNIEFFGSAPSVDDVHTFTDDFFALASTEATRANIADTNGGVDWVNLAAIVDDLTLDFDTSISPSGTIAADTPLGSQVTTVNDLAAFENFALGDGNDSISLSRDLNIDNHVLGMRGNDTIFGGAGNDKLAGGEGRDRLFGDDAADDLLGDGGADLLNGGQGRDSLDGGLGNDTLFGGQGNDTLLGGGQSDLIFGGILHDSIEGGAGSDTLHGEGGLDRIDGGGGFDYIDGGIGNDILRGGDAKDTIFGGVGADRLLGEQGEDSLDGGTEGDALFGGEGNDTLIGGGGADNLNGGRNADILDGGAGSDTLTGDGGSDTLNGGTGNDILTGSNGRDVFVFDFNSGTDTIDDFSIWQTGEVIDLTSMGLNAVNVSIVTGAGGTTITWGTADSIFLDGVTGPVLLGDDVII